MKSPVSESFLPVRASAWSRFFEKKSTVAALVFIVLVMLACFLAPFIISYSFSEQDLMRVGESPSWGHWFGTDLLGRDLLSRILYGGRISFLVAFVATFVALFIGVSYGAISGWLGGRLDSIMMRVVEVFYSMPYVIFVILMMVFFGRGLWPLLVALGLVEWLSMARLVRGEVMALKKQCFVDAAKCTGQSTVKIMILHILPNVLPTILTCIALTIPTVMLLESFISFLGLGVQAPMTSWGDLIKEGASAMEHNPYLLVLPGFFFVSTLFALNAISTRIQELFDKKRD